MNKGIKSLNDLGKAINRKNISETGEEESKDREKVEGQEEIIKDGEVLSSYVFKILDGKKDN